MLLSAGRVIGKVVMAKKKSKAQEQLERMTEERDNWRNLVALRDEKIEDLQNELERVGALGLALSGKGGIAEKFQRERNEARKKVSFFRQVAENVFSKATGAEEELRNYVTARIDAMSDSIFPMYLTAVVAAVLHKDRAGQHNEIGREIIKAGTQHEPEKIIPAIYRLGWLCGAHEIAAKLIVWLRSIGDPLMTCYYVREDLRSRGFTEMDIVERFELSWVKENISARIGSKEVLLDYINVAWEYKNSGARNQSYASYAMDKPPSEAYLKLASRCLNKILEHAAQAPEDVIGDTVEFYTIMATMGES